MKAKLIVAVIILSIVLTSLIIFKPYSNVELNAGTIYYQSYSQLYRSIKDYVDMLENYHDTEDKIHLEFALIKLETIGDNLRIFRLANQSQFRNTYIYEKVVKTDFLDAKVQPLQYNYDYSRAVLEQFLVDNKLESTSFQDFLYYNQLILSGLSSENYGYHTETKEFRVVLDDNNRILLEEGLTGLEEIVIRVITS